MTKPKAMRLAEIASYLEENEKSRWITQTCNELRRLHQVNQELLEALQSFPGFIDDATIGDVWIEKKNAAIAKATQEK